MILPKSEWDNLCTLLYWVKEESEIWAKEGQDDPAYVKEHANRAHTAELLINKLALFIDHTEAPLTFVDAFKMRIAEFNAVQWVVAHDLWHFERYALLALRCEYPLLAEKMDDMPHLYYVVTAKVGDLYQTAIYCREDPLCQADPITTNRHAQKMCSTGSNE